MGGETSKEEAQEKKILRSPNIGEASNLYWASRAGDVDAVRQILDTTNFNELNHLEPNGSTALHAASFFGHSDVVRLLLQERGVMRHRKNRHGLTAYDEAANDDIRQLFYRPNVNRFCEVTTNDNGCLFNFSTDLPSEDDENDDNLEQKRAVELDGDSDVRLKALMKTMRLMYHTPIISPIVMKVLERTMLHGEKREDSAIDEIEVYINDYVTPAHHEYEKVCELLSKFRQTKKPEHLLRLYSLETPFYRNLTNAEMNLKFFFLLFFRLNILKSRAYQGRTYRGLAMTRNDIKPYQRSLEQQMSLISVTSFCSTSIDENVAKRFIPAPCTDSLSVLMVFDFPEPCDTAIQLYAVSETLPCISDFEDEREVLVLPLTVFHVIDINKENGTNLYTIYLKNELPKLAWRKVLSS